MKFFFIFFHFYKTYVAWSFVVTILLGFVDSHYVPAIVTKLFLTIFAGYVTKETSSNRKLTFYKNLGISTYTLFFSMFIVDSVLTVLIIFLFKI
ncbi:hypothetical protein BWZ20_12775 [Winogradskyella sp. J14-2]|nr:hypothetical protein BWZ20_12775 [Winogradskyella sp. J14-2]